MIARRTGKKWFIAGLNGTDMTVRLKLDMKQFTNLEGFSVNEGTDPLWDFTVKPARISDWQCRMRPLGGFVLCLEPAGHAGE